MVARALGRFARPRCRSARRILAAKLLRRRRHRAPRRRAEPRAPLRKARSQRTASTARSTPCPGAPRWPASSACCRGRRARASRFSRRPTRRSNGAPIWRASRATACASRAPASRAPPAPRTPPRSSSMRRCCAPVRSPARWPRRSSARSHTPRLACSSASRCRSSRPCSSSSPCWARRLLAVDCAAAGAFRAADARRCGLRDRVRASCARTSRSKRRRPARTRSTAPSASRASRTCGCSRSACSPGAASSATTATGPRGSAAAWPRAGPWSSGADLTARGDACGSAPAN